MRGPGSKASFLFKLVIPATSVFAITVLSMIAVLFSNQQAPLAQLLNKYGNTLLAAEFFAVIVLALLAMTVEVSRADDDGPRRPLVVLATQPIRRPWQAPPRHQAMPGGPAPRRVRRPTVGRPLLQTARRLPIRSPMSSRQ